MADYRELVKKYEKRRHDTLLDSVSAGLSYADNVAVEAGLLADSGIIDAVSVAAPFVLIAVTEEMKVILGKKTERAGLSDAVERMLRTGTAMGVGALAAAVTGGAAAAIPAAVATRSLLKSYKSRAGLNLRVSDRIDRLRALREKRQKKMPETVRSCWEDSVNCVGEAEWTVAADR